MNPQNPHHRRLVHTTLRCLGPSTHDRLEAALATVLPPSTVRGISVGLRRAGDVVDTGRYGRTRAGCWARVWRIA